MCYAFIEKMNIDVIFLSVSIVLSRRIIKGDDTGVRITTSFSLLLHECEDMS
jgi:hypothetical protein